MREREIVNKRKEVKKRDRQTDRQTGRQAGRQTDSQTDRQRMRCDTKVGRSASHSSYIYFFFII